MKRSEDRELMLHERIERSKTVLKWAAILFAAEIIVLLVIHYELFGDGAVGQFVRQLNAFFAGVLFPRTTEELLAGETYRCYIKAFFDALHNTVWAWLLKWILPITMVNTFLSIQFSMYQIRHGDLTIRFPDMSRITGKVKQAVGKLSPETPLLSGLFPQAVEESNKRLTSACTYEPSLKDCGIRVQFTDGRSVDKIFAWDKANRIDFQEITQRPFCAYLRNGQAYLHSAGEDFAMTPFVPIAIAHANEQTGSERVSAYITWLGGYSL